MKQLGCLIFLIMSLCITACSSQSSRYVTHDKNAEFFAALSDPAVRKQFKLFKAEAVDAAIYYKNGRPYIAEADIKKLNAITASLINNLENEYHIDADHYKVHTFIARNEMHSCYQYYNSLAMDSIGKTCHEFSETFASCQLCDNYVNAVRSRKFSIIRAKWWMNEKTVDLVDVAKLKNHDSVYLGLEVSVY